MNPLGAAALVLSLAAFALCYGRLRQRPVRVRAVWCGIFALLAVPSLLFAIYYLHILPEREWFYNLRSWRGTEFLVVFLGCAAGTVASFLPRLLLVVPLFALMVLATVPHIKPLVGPLPDAAFAERWLGDVCLQSTQSTCGPACVTTILKQLGADVSEQATARAAFSYSGGTEAWYLARYVRSKGFVPRFEFREGYSLEAGLPAVVGIRLGSIGHFIAVLGLNGDEITYVDPLQGKLRLPVSEFMRRYDFTGFHMVITKR